MIKDKRLPWWVIKGVLNPMKEPQVVQKMKISLKETQSQEGYVHPNTGRERVDVKVRMDSENNPMKNEDSKKKREESKKVYNDLLRGDINPMKNKDFVAKCMASYKETVSQPNYVSPIKGKPSLLKGTGKPKSPSQICDCKECGLMTKPGNKYINHHSPNKGENNPLVKDPELAKRIWEKSRTTLEKNGRVSIGEKLLLSTLDSLNISYESQKFFLLMKDSRHWCFIDAYLKDFNLALEYDGFSSHYTTDKNKDDIRDKCLLSLYDVMTIRINRKTVFEKDFRDRLLGVINEFTMEKSDASHFVGRRI